MAITIDDFSKIWASDSPLTPYQFSESQYKEGWNFIGGTPPSRQMWDFLQKNNDEKMQYLAEFIQALASVLVPTGCVQAFAGQTTPAGWLLCDGSAVSRTTYANLFAVIGTTYGAGDGSTTFNLPNLVDKFIEGSSTAGTVKSAGLPNIEAHFEIRRTNGTALTIMNSWGAMSQRTTSSDDTSGIQSGTVGNRDIVDFYASNFNSIYGNSTTVQPPALTMRYIIKY